MEEGDVTETISQVYQHETNGIEREGTETTEINATDIDDDDKSLTNQGQGSRLWEGEAEGEAGLLMRRMNLEKIAASDIFIGDSLKTWWGRLFGGQILGQSVQAASATVAPDKVIHSMHGYFLLAGKNDTQVLFKVERVRDGGSFSTRIVNVLQENKMIFTITIQFHREEPGLDFSLPITQLLGSIDQGWTKMEQIPQPEALQNSGVAPNWDCSESVEALLLGSGDQWHMWWGRVVDGGLELFPDDSPIHQALLAYMSDLGMVTTVKRPHGNFEFSMSMTLNHSVYFHRRFRADRWLLFHMATTVSNGARGLANGSVYQDGVHVASLVQEALIRVPRLAPPPPKLELAAKI
eukprot:m.16804 g.16804  ORF g.16804 m.16804 type:complete len:351 (+) comp11216_c0_seq1:230-1282(+)